MDFALSVREDDRRRLRSGGGQPGQPVGLRPDRPLRPGRLLRPGPRSGGRRAGAAPGPPATARPRQRAPVPAGRRHPRPVLGGERLCGRLPGAAPGSAGRAPLPGRSRRRTARRRRQAGRPAVVGRAGRRAGYCGSPVRNRWWPCTDWRSPPRATTADIFITRAGAPRTRWTRAPAYPIANDVASVTVLAPTCMAADALSTALTVMGVEAGLPFAEERGLAARFCCARRRPARSRYARLARAMLQ
jgi:hypothetical protein